MTSAAKNLAKLTALLILAACGSDSKPPTGIIVDPPVVVVPPVITANTAQIFEVALNAAVDAAPSVTVKDKSGNAVPNIWIRWAPSTGKVENDSSLTDINGRANAGKWTVGTVSGLQTVTASTGTGAGAASAIALTAKVAPGPLVALTTVTPTITAVVNSTLTTPASIKAVDAFGNGVPNIAVQFAKWNGDGVLTGTSQITNENGIATVGSWKLGPQVGAQSIRVDESRTGATTMVHAIATAAPATQFVIIDGNAQSGQANKRLCTSPTISVRDQFGNGVGQIPIVFTPGAGSGTVTDASVTSSAATGNATVGAWMLSANATQTLVVSSPSLPGVTATITATVGPSASYTVCARYVGAFSARQRQAVATAIERWQRVITAHVATTQLTENANRCFTGAPAINELVEDLLVYVQLTTIDGPGNAVARAGPCTVHQPSGLTQLGVLQLDSIDLDVLLNQGTLDNMVTHELGHVLGFGSLWSSSGRTFLNGSGTADPFFSGASARAEFAKLFPTYAGNAVPVENIGDVGTVNNHWRRSLFNNELMQGFSQATMPMSRITVGSLGDLGYSVDLTKADPFAFVGALQSATASSLLTDFGDDILRNEIWGTYPDGRRVLIRRANGPGK